MMTGRLFSRCGMMRSPWLQTWRKNVTISRRHLTFTKRSSWSTIDMPGILYQPLARRSFLKAVSLGGIALVLGGCQTSSQRRASGAQKFHLALLSDTHIAADPKNEYRGFNPTENLKRIVPEVVAAKPEAVILNGDAARLEGLPGDYMQLKSLLHP